MRYPTREQQWLSWSGMVTRRGVVAKSAQPGRLRAERCRGHTTDIMASGEKRYAAADVREILRRAQHKDSLAVRSDSAGLSEAELLENAKELGFSPQDVKTAMVAFDEDRQVGVAASELRQLAYRRLSTHAIVYLSFLAILTATGAWAAAGTPLFVVAIVWAMLFLFQLRGALFPDPDKLREAARQWLLSRKLKESGKQFGTALATGAAKLLTLSAQKIDEGVKQLDK